jgi:hypothetical protein
MRIEIRYGAVGLVKKTTTARMEAHPERTGCPGSLERQIRCPAEPLPYRK